MNVNRSKMLQIRVTPAEMQRYREDGKRGVSIEQRLIDLANLRGGAKFPGTETLQTAPLPPRAEPPAGPLPTPPDRVMVSFSKPPAQAAEKLKARTGMCEHRIPAGSFCRRCNAVQ